MAYDEAFSRKNIVSGFAKSGIFPFQRSVFSDTDFISSLPTDQAKENGDNEGSCRSNLEEPKASTSENTSTNQMDVENYQINSQFENEKCTPTVVRKYPKKVKVVTPEQVRPFPKAPLRNNTQKPRGRKKGKTCILTDTPEKNRIEAAVKSKKIKEELGLKKEYFLAYKKKLFNGDEQGLSKSKGKSKQKKRKRRIHVDSSSTSENEEDDIECYSDKVLSPLVLSEDSDIEESKGEKVESDGSNINVLDFVLVRLASKKSEKFYVAQINDKICLTEFNVSFLRKKRDQGHHQLNLSNLIFQM
ncbi:Palmitoyltransferase zdhhc13 [Homalodisca vitripennis]|nr:Palmitoyltransferase zdhhc13 [Homalodisca vitripennis]